LTEYAAPLSYKTTNTINPHAHSHSQPTVSFTTTPRLQLCGSKDVNKFVKADPPVGMHVRLSRLACIEDTWQSYSSSSAIPTPAFYLSNHRPLLQLRGSKDVNKFVKADPPVQIHVQLRRLTCIEDTWQSYSSSEIPTPAFHLSNHRPRLQLRGSKDVNKLVKVDVPARPNSRLTK